MRDSRGFTLVELMVVIAIVGILAATSLPLGRTWVSEAKVTKVRGEITEALGKAKGVAIRNQMLATGTDPVTAVCIAAHTDEDLNTLTVLERNNSATNPATSPDCANTVGDEIFTTTIPSVVTITTDIAGAVANVTCACFDGTGLSTTAAPCDVCVSTINAPITLTAGANSDEMFVD